MTVQTLTVAEPSLTSTTSERRAGVTRASFGDGYSQRARRGVNNVVRTMRLEWRALPNAEAAALVAFLEARAGAEAFDWTPPGEAQAVRFSCEEWSDVPIGRGVRTVSAVFVQEFDLG